MPSAKVQHENDILINLVKQSGLYDVINPKIKNSLWIQVTQKFNRITGHDWDKKRLKTRWKNYRLHNKETFTKGKMPINNENDKKLSDIPDNPSENIEEDSNNCEGFFENRQTNSSEITNETLPRAKTQYENDILINLVKQFGLNDKTVINPKIRISLWIQVTKKLLVMIGTEKD